MSRASDKPSFPASTARQTCPEDHVRNIMPGVSCPCCSVAKATLVQLRNRGPRGGSRGEGLIGRGMSRSGVSRVRFDGD